MSIWFITHPTSQYCEDVKALAKERGLKIVDARYQNGRPQSAGAPHLTRCDEEPVTDIDKLKAEADALGVEYGPRIGYKTLLERVEEARG